MNGEHWQIQGVLPPPQASRFFRFYILIFRKVTVSDLGFPLRVWRPTSGNPRSATGVSLHVTMTPHQSLFKGFALIWRSFDHICLHQAKVCVLINLDKLGHWILLPSNVHLYIIIGKAFRANCCVINQKLLFLSFTDFWGKLVLPYLSVVL